MFGGGRVLDHDFKETSKQVVHHIKFWNKLRAQLVEACNLMFPKVEWLTGAKEELRIKRDG